MTARVVRNRLCIAPHETPSSVIPAKAGIHWLLIFCFAFTQLKMDSRFRGNDGVEVF